MTTITAVSTGGSWSNVLTWSPAQIPTAADDVIIDASMTGTVTINGSSGSPSLCRSLDCTGCTGTVTSIANAVLEIGDGSGGSLTLVSGMTFHSPSVVFVSTTTGNVVTPGGQGIGPITFNGAGGSWTLGGDLESSTITLIKGTLNDGGYSVTSDLLSSSNSNTRALTMTGTWTLVDNLGPLIWDISNAAGMTLSAGSSTISLEDEISTSTFEGGGLTYGTFTLVGLWHDSILTITGANTFGDLSLANDAFNSCQVILAADQTVTGTFAANGNSVLNRLYITSDTKGVARTISAGTVSASNLDMQDITGAGAASWNLASVTGGSGDCGRNSGITFTSPITCYMKTGVSVNWSASNWYTTSGGSTAARIPLPQDTARFDSNSFSSSGITVTLDSSIVRVSGMNWTGVTHTPTLAFTNSQQYFGDIVLSSGMSISGGGDLVLDGAGGDITSAGLTWTPLIEVDCGTGTWTQQDDFTTSGEGLAVTSGTWAIGAHSFFATGSYPSTAVGVDGGIISSTTGTISLTSNGEFYVESGTVSMLNGSIDLSMAGPSLSGGTLIVGTLSIGGGLDIQGTDVQIGTGGAAYTSFGALTGGSLTAISGYSLTVTATAITVSAGGGGSAGPGSWTFC